MIIADVLAERYASSEMKNIWGAHAKILLERELWIAVMKAQRELGLDIPAEAIAAYESVKENIDVDSINRREKLTRHDVKARIDEFAELADCEHIHKGMTSRDLTECVEQLQVYKSLQLIMMKSVAALGAFSSFSEKYADFPYAARTHNVIAQLTTLGKRFAMFGEDLLHAVNALQDFIDSYPVRGLKGAVGTQLDQLTLFNNDRAKSKKLNELVLRHLGFSKSFGATGQVYPRSLDFEAVSRLYQIGSGPSSFAKTLRIMAGHELAGEGFAKGQTGSSAMPHKMNSRSCERLNGFHVILRGFMEMGASLAGDQWNEGDVSCSVVRRVMLPGSFFAIDGLFETFLTISRQMEINEAVIAAEREKYMPFLLTTTVMMRAVKNGAGREDAHEVIKEHAVATLRDLRNGKIIANDLFDRLAFDSRLPITAEELSEALDFGRAETGMAKEQALQFVDDAAVWLKKYPEAASYAPGDIL